jgi:outer membrane lipoprotein-sorting protein
MNRRTFLLTSLLIPTLAHAQAAFSAQDRADIARAEAALNAIHTLKARFQQIAPNGSISGGTAWLDRPGRMRFQYDPPSPFLLVAGYGLLVFHDSQLGQTSNIPLGRTPLGLLLQDNLKLSGDVTVTKVTRFPGQFQVTVVRTASPADGSITLIFADNPVALRSWVVIDAQRQETRISLFDVELGGTFASSLFTYVDPAILGTPSPGQSN